MRERAGARRDRVEIPDEAVNAAVRIMLRRCQSEAASFAPFVTLG